jgi:hypothetical protein
MYMLNITWFVVLNIDAIGEVNHAAIARHRYLYSQVQRTTYM